MGLAASGHGLHGAARVLTTPTLNSPEASVAGRKASRNHGSAWDESGHRRVETDTDELAPMGVT